MESNSTNPLGISILSLSHNAPSTFTLFSTLPHELRTQIWTLALPGPRCMQIYWSTSFRTSVHNYITFPNSYGGSHPTILSVSHESRTEALRHLTPRFNAYWNLEIDTVYLEAKKWKQNMEQWGIDHLQDLAEKGLLEGFKHLALDSSIWERESALCLPCLRLLPNIRTLSVVFRFRTPPLYKEVLSLGESWYLLLVTDEVQTELTPPSGTYAVVERFEAKMKREWERFLAEDQEKWEGAPPDVRSCVIAGRKMELVSERSARQGVVDWFGLIW